MTVEGAILVRDFFCGTVMPLLSVLRFTAIATCWVRRKAEVRRWHRQIIVEHSRTLGVEMIGARVL